MTDQSHPTHPAHPVPDPFPFAFSPFRAFASNRPTLTACHEPGRTDAYPRPDQAGGAGAPAGPAERALLRGGVPRGGRGDAAGGTPRSVRGPARDTLRPAAAAPGRGEPRSAVPGGGGRHRRPGTG